jgi:peptidoglycan hydrolase-like protein with peptidoglycan-binding domain
MWATIPTGVKVVGGVLAGLGLWKVFESPKVQALRRHSSTGVPVQVVVPVHDKKPELSVGIVPIPPNNGSGAVFQPGVTRATIITPGGAARLHLQTIQDVQKALNTLGLQPPLAADGILGTLTQTALRAFQGRGGLPADGQITPPLKDALQKALAGTAATGSQLGTSFTVQAAQVSPLAGQALAATGMNGDPSYFGAEGDPSPPSRDKIAAWQRALNALGAAPKLDETGVMNPETVAATQALQISLGLVADGVPGPKTQTAAAVSLNPGATAAIVPSIPKAASHVAAVASTATPPLAPELLKSASNLAAAASNPTPTVPQTAASTVAANTASAAIGAAPLIATHLASASADLAASASAPTPAAATQSLAEAANHLNDAAKAASSDASASASLTAAADHTLTAAATADPIKQADALTAASAHIANATANNVSPTLAAAINGEWPSSHVFSERPRFGYQDGSISYSGAGFGTQEPSISAGGAGFGIAPPAPTGYRPAAPAAPGGHAIISPFVPGPVGVWRPSGAFQPLPQSGVYRPAPPTGSLGYRPAPPIGYGRPWGRWNQPQPPLGGYIPQPPGPTGMSNMASGSMPNSPIDPTDMTDTASGNPDDPTGAGATDDEGDISNAGGTLDSAGEYDGHRAGVGFGNVNMRAYYQQRAESLGGYPGNYSGGYVAPPTGIPAPPLGGPAFMDPLRRREFERHREWERRRELGQQGQLLTDTVPWVDPNASNAAVQDPAADAQYTDG